MNTVLLDVDESGPLGPAGRACARSIQRLRFRSD